jgi:NADPH:quinone reductase-like Zn-dependent oxidoreductase
MTQPPPRSDVEVRPAQVKYDAALLNEIAALVQSKVVRPLVSEVFPFSDALNAFQHVMTGHTRGKLVLEFGR